jgi:F0F1-type ATP synthase assembly protein I
MRNVDIPLHELAFIAGTRGMLGAGLGLLLSNYLRPESRKAVGLTLIAIGAATTIPIAKSVLSRQRLIQP